MFQKEEVMIAISKDGNQVGFNSQLNVFLLWFTTHFSHLFIYVFYKSLFAFLRSTNPPRRTLIVCLCRLNDLLNNSIFQDHYEFKVMNYAELIIQTFLEQLWKCEKVQEKVKELKFLSHCNLIWFAHFFGVHSCFHLSRKYRQTQRYFSRFVRLLCALMYEMVFGLLKLLQNWSKINTLISEKVLTVAKNLLTFANIFRRFQ